MKVRNIVLIGMMGCGKTTVGKIVAERLKLRFIDLDHYIESKWSSIPALFEKGEEYFRDIETKALKEVSKVDGAVIATGGGVIKRSENIAALKERGILFFLDRPVEDILADIDTDHRPLLKDGKNKLMDLFNERYPLYIKACDIHVRETNTLEDAVNQVIREWKNRQFDNR
ncbi:MAG: shikimate kinase [Thermoclostridium sp.]|nr:shikimate kinase [Thermoclostridium sp.]